MTGSASKRWTLRVTCDSLLRERVQGEGGVSVGPDRRLADDGKRFQAKGVVFSSRRQYLYPWGGGPGEGWAKNRTGPEAGGFLFGPSEARFSLENIDIFVK